VTNHDFLQRWIIMNYTTTSCRISQSFRSSNCNASSNGVSPYRRNTSLQYMACTITQVSHVLNNTNERNLLGKLDRPKTITGRLTTRSSIRTETTEERQLLRSDIFFFVSKTRFNQFMAFKSAATSLHSSAPFSHFS
jgi:hypothetical protein